MFGWVSIRSSLVVGVVVPSTGAQLLQQFALLAPLAMLRFAIDLVGKGRQLLDGEQAGAALHQRQDPPMQCLALQGWQSGIALRMHLGGQMEAGLLHPRR